VIQGNTVLFVLILIHQATAHQKEELRKCSDNDDTIPSIPSTSAPEVEDDANSGENTSPRIPTKGDGLSTLDGDKVLSPSP
jgi:hypothetical protein